MKPIVEKILKSGIIDKHTAALMERWRLLEVGAADMVGEEDLRETSAEALLKFAEELEELIETEKTRLLETRLAIGLTNPFLAVVRYDRTGYEERVVLFRDEMGNFLFPSFSPVVCGTKFRTIDDIEYRVIDFVPLYDGEDVCAIQVKAERIIPGAG